LPKVPEKTLLGTRKKWNEERHRDPDRWICSVPSGRVIDRETASLTLKAVYPTEIRSIVVPIVIRNSIPEPELTAIKTILNGKQSVSANRTESKLVWDGRSELIL
jgi:hypothetical protein